MTKAVSFIMPAKNAAKHVFKAVDSTLKIMSDKDELLILDDGSSDDTPAIIDRFQDSRIRVFTNRESQGVANSLNSLLEKAKSPIIARMDADDINLPWRRRHGLNLLENLDGGFVFGGAILFGTGLKFPIPQWPQEINNGNLFAKLSESNPFVHSSLFASRKTLLDLGGYLDVKQEDYELWTRAALAGVPMLKSRIPTVLYRVHAGQTTARSNWGSDLENYGNRFEIHPAEKRSGFSEKLRSAVLSSAERKSRDKH